MAKLASTCAAIGSALAVCSFLVTSAAGTAGVEIPQREQQLYNWIVAHDTSEVSQIVTKDYTMTTGSGRQLNRTEFLASVADRSSKVLSLTIHSETVRPYGTDAAVVVGLLDEVEARRDNHTILRIPFLETWVRQTGSWQLAASQQSFPLLSRNGRSFF